MPLWTGTCLASGALRGPSTFLRHAVQTDLAIPARSMSKGMQ